MFLKVHPRQQKETIYRFTRSQLPAGTRRLTLKKVTRIRMYMILHISQPVWVKYQSYLLWENQSTLLHQTCRRIYLHSRLMKSDLIQRKNCMCNGRDLNNSLNNRLNFNTNLKNLNLNLSFNPNSNLNLLLAR